MICQRVSTFDRQKGKMEGGAYLMEALVKEIQWAWDKVGPRIFGTFACGGDVLVARSRHIETEKMG